LTEQLYGDRVAVNNYASNFFYEYPKSYCPLNFKASDQFMKSPAVLRAKGYPVISGGDRCRCHFFDMIQVDNIGQMYSYETIRTLLAR